MTGARAWGPVLILVLLAACEPVPPERQRVVGGDPEAGRALILAYQCGACHVVPGIRPARGTVGPSLRDFGRRAYVGGVLPNRPDELVRWLVDPPGVSPQTAMPNLGLSEGEARHVAAYLYTLR